MGLVTTLKYSDSILQIKLFNDFDLVGNITIQVFNPDCYFDQFLHYTTQEKFLKTFKNQRIAWITFINIRLQYRNNGYSKILISKAIDWLFKQGIGNFALEVAPAFIIDKDSLARYYATFGFSVLVKTNKDLIMYLRKEK